MPTVIVCVKQSYEVTEIKINPTNNKPILEGVPLVISEYDKNAIEEAVRIKEKHGWNVSVITATPFEASKTVKEALAIGADNAYVINHKAFAESDTYVMARVVSEAIKKIGEYSLILCGEGSSDSFTGRFGPMVAQFLGIPEVAYVEELNIKDNKVEVKRSVEEGEETIEVEMPALLTVTSKINEPRIPTLMDILKGSKKPITQWTIQDLGLTEKDIGKNGSTTHNIDFYAPPMKRKNVIIEKEKIEEAVDELIRSLQKEGVL